MIPRRIFTIWTSEDPTPPLIERCIKSHQIPGYEHRLITKDNIYLGSQFVNDAFMAKEKLGTKRWCKVSDFLRSYYLWAMGGIYLDADMEVLPGKNFDDLLDNKMFISKDEAGNFASTAMGAEAGHPFLGYIIGQMDDNFKGNGGMVWEPGFLFFTESMKKFGQFDPTIKVFESDVFFPYHWEDKTINITPNTKVYHHYFGSWTK
jgi:mannosyltransferase OCH1-like enzyme